MSITAYMQAVLRNNKNNSLQKNNRFQSAAKRTHGKKVDYTFYDAKSTEEELSAIRTRVRKRERRHTIILLTLLIIGLIITTYFTINYIY